jgi:ribonuclease VapC
MPAAIAIDTSAILAVLMRESDSELVHGQILAAKQRMISAVTMVESAIVLENKLGATGSRSLEEFVRDHKLEIVAVDAEHGRAALLAYWRFGRGLHHARLNFGDCFSYALAKVKGIPLVFKGGDFAQTDIRILDPKL